MSAEPSAPAASPVETTSAATSLPPDTRTLLVKVFGKDRPGITTGLFTILAEYDLDVVDF